MSFKWLVVGLFFWSQFILAAELYVSTSGSDSSAGSASAPFRTIQKAASVATAGTNVHVAPGTYSGPIRTTAKGTASARIRFVSDNKWGAKIIPGGSNYGWYDSGDYIEINGFDFDGQSSSSWRDGVLARGSYTLITNNHVHHIADNVTCDSNGGSGINMGSYEYGTHQDAISNVVHNIGFRGCNTIQGIYAATSGTVKNNLVYQIGRWAIHLWHDASNIDVVNNTVFASSGGIVIGGGEFYHISGPVDNVHVHNNIVYNNDDGILEEGDIGSHNTYLNNISYNNRNYNYNLMNSHSGDLNADPQFVNYVAAGGGDYHLKSTSPAVDRGTSSYAPSSDLDGNARPQGGTFDIGAYELVMTTPTPAPSLAISSTQMIPGGAITVNVSGVGKSTEEYVALYLASAADSAYAYNNNWQYLNGTQTQPSSLINSATLTFKAPMEAGTYNIRLFSTDAATAGSRMAISPNIQVVAADVIAPSTSITSPANGSPVFVRTKITIQASATDNVGVKSVEFYVNGSLKCTTTAAPYKCVWFVPRGRGKVYSLQTKAKDADGNVGSSAIVKVTSQ